MCDRTGAIYEGRPGLNPAKAEIAAITNRDKRSGTLAEMPGGADVHRGSPALGMVTPEMVGTMAKDAILFPMANPTPEIMPDLARAAGAAVVGTNRSDFPTRSTTSWPSPGFSGGPSTSGPRTSTTP